jgi:hypothetical protein
MHAHHQSLPHPQRVQPRRFDCVQQGSGQTVAARFCPTDRPNLDVECPPPADACAAAPVTDSGSSSAPPGSGDAASSHQTSTPEEHAAYSDMEAVADALGGGGSGAGASGSAAPPAPDTAADPVAPDNEAGAAQIAGDPAPDAAVDTPDVVIIGAEESPANIGRQATDHSGNQLLLESGRAADPARGGSNIAGLPFNPRPSVEHLMEAGNSSSSSGGDGVEVVQEQANTAASAAAGAGATAATPVTVASAAPAGGGASQDQPYVNTTALALACSPEVAVDINGKCCQGEIKERSW